MFVRVERVRCLESWDPLDTDFHLLGQGCEVTGLARCSLLVDGKLYKSVGDLHALLMQNLLFAIDDQPPLDPSTSSSSNFVFVEYLDIAFRWMMNIELRLRTKPCLRDQS